jgi:hypothetical protein
MLACTEYRGMVLLFEAPPQRNTVGDTSQQ